MTNRFFLKLTGVFVLSFLFIAAAPLHALEYNLTCADFSCIATDNPPAVKFLQMKSIPSVSAFVQVGHNNQNVVQGYNTTINNVLDNASSDTFNHAIAITDVPTVLYGGISYREFNLEIKQSPQNPKITLDDVQVFLTSTGNQSVTTFTSGQLNLANSQLIYRMDGGGTNDTILLDFSLNSSTNSGDMTMLVPNSLFTAALASHPTFTSLVLYSHFGGDLFGGSTFPNNIGFEEWFVCAPRACTPESVPEPSSLMLLGMGLIIGAGQLSKRWKRKD